MITLRGFALAAVTLVALAGCAKTGSSPQDTAADQSAIRAQQGAWYKAYNAGDGAAVAALYAEDAVLSAPDKPAARGGAAIREYYLKDAAEFSASGLKAEEGPSSDVGISGDLAWQGDTYKVTDKSGATVQAGKTLSVFQRRDGKWLMIRDTWNSDTAPAATASNP